MFCCLSHLPLFFTFFPSFLHITMVISFLSSHSSSTKYAAHYIIHTYTKVFASTRIDHHHHHQQQHHQSLSYYTFILHFYYTFHFWFECECVCVGPFVSFSVYCLKMSVFIFFSSTIDNIVTQTKYNRRIASHKHTRILTTN